MKRPHLVREIVETVVLTLLVFFVIHVTTQSYRVDGISMQPGLVSNEYVLVNKTAYLFHAPMRGDVIVFHYPVDPRLDFIKRVVGLPGDTITIDSKTIRVDGTLLKEPYITMPVNPTGKILKVLADEYFVMGDNRPASDDSRSWGTVPKNYIVGKAVVVYWPLPQGGSINTYPAVFDPIKGNR